MRIIAMDAGQTGIRAQLRVDGRIEAEVETAGVLADRPVVPQLAEVVRRLDAAQASVAIGSSGLGEDVTAASLLDLLRDDGVTQVALTHDSITSYLGALGATPGAVVASGTGVVTLALGEESLARVDGWGHLIGDAGSGFWIGLAAFDATMRAFDGRGPATSLTDAIFADFESPENIYLELQADPYRVSRIASYAKLVADLADKDAVCTGICERAGAELATSVTAALTRVGQANRHDPAVSTLGNVFRGRVLANAFADEMTRRFPHVRILPPAGTGLDGAANIAQLTPASALWQRISLAR